MRALDDSYEKLTELKTEFYRTLHEWQVSLYPSEFQPIAERYIELYRILNLDKILRGEIMSHLQKTVDEGVKNTEIPEESMPENKMTEDVLRGKRILGKRFRGISAGSGAGWKGNRILRTDNGSAPETQYYLKPFSEEI